LYPDKKTNIDQKIKNIKWNHITIDEFLVNKKIENINNLFLVWNIDLSKIENIFDLTRWKWIQVYHISDNFFIKDIITVPTWQNGLHCIEYKASKIDEWNLVIKRLFDIFVSFFGIIFLSPLFLIISILIKIDSKWPIFYIQKRVGKWWNLFDFIKFRSMYVEDCVWEKYWWYDADQKYQNLINSKQNIRKWILSKFENDPRVTKIWKFIRKTSIDELPSLRSVFRWDMSIVWPRPHMEHEISKYENWHKRLFSTKPWITWYAQIMGRDKLNFDDEANFDLYYIQNWNLFFDIYIIIMTITVALRWK